jgi:MoxR-like ATPase
VSQDLKSTDAAEQDWRLYRCAGQTHDGITRLPPPPPWRKFAEVTDIPAEGLQKSIAAPPDDRSRNNPERGQTYLATDEQIRLVNLALYLRRPLLITGKPGTGKSSLAYSVAYELNLGPVLRWPITSRSTLAEGLYRYDAIGRLQEAQLNPGKAVEIGNYLSLGPLGTALLPAERPRVLLIDEIDKSDIDLPNDLLNIFEEGEYEIPELARYPKEHVDVRLFESKAAVRITKGKARCCAFPFVALTSNGEREFPAPLLRRCLRLDITPPNKEALASIVKAHLNSELKEKVEPLIEKFLEHRRSKGHLANDQLLNTIFMLTQAIGLNTAAEEEIRQALFQTLGSTDAT